jgi:hypothetical protein
VLVDRAMEFCWRGVERLPERSVEMSAPVAR